MTLDNASHLPHLGSATIATRTAMGEKVLANLQAYFSGEELPDRVIQSGTTNHESAYP
ncbi:MULTISPECIES: hypothetical protein [unclassified Methylomonas]|uniref:hypothetical protein n=1 Tax=unclassified Methylomonas TaxID=2608980 RepID=UPI000A90A3DF|nr:MULTISPECIES: hypothetical protein [unclassified Methylomonas]